MQGRALSIGLFSSDGLDGQHTLEIPSEVRQQLGSKNIKPNKFRLRLDQRHKSKVLFSDKDKM